MRIIVPTALAALTLSACATMDAPASDAFPRAAATLRTNSGAVQATAQFVQSAGGVSIAVATTGVAPGTYGIHLHTTGKCDAPDFTTAGGHWNPTALKHGLENSAGPHGGDLPNIVVGASGVGTLTRTLSGATLTGTAGLLDADGAAIIIHAGPDDNKTDPSGNSGARMLCGVIAAQ